MAARRTSRAAPASPTAVLLGMMLLIIGERRNSARIRRALERVLSEGHVRTRDLGGSAGTDEFTAAIIAALD
jgi:isocitrate/isopropylmalate dehydrogenase